MPSYAKEKLINEPKSLTNGIPVLTKASKNYTSEFSPVANQIADFQKSTQ